MEPLSIRAIEASDREWVSRSVAERWGSDVMVVHGTIYQPAQLPGLVAWQGGSRVGLLTYHLDDASCEIVSLDSFSERRGIGSALMRAAADLARTAGVRRLWLITTNDNLRALRFYQKRGFRLSALFPDAVTAARRIKPEIPQVGQDGIPIRDELELEMELH